MTILFWKQMSLGDSELEVRGALSPSLFPSPGTIPSAWALKMKSVVSPASPELLARTQCIWETQ